MGIFDFLKKKEEPNVIIRKTAQEKYDEKLAEQQAKKCPNCGRDPEGGPYHHGIVIGSYTVGTGYSNITCTHCDTDYSYKRGR